MRMVRGFLPAWLLLPLLGACSANLPNLGNLSSVTRIGQSSLPVGPDKEREIGFGIAATVAGRYRMVDDESLSRYVSLVGQTVVRQSTRNSEIPFHFGVLDTDDVNAFAAPGGYVLVTRGALSRMESEAELAGVLAHEVAHIDETHVLDEIRRSSVFASARDEAELTGPLVDRLADFGSSLLFTGLSREDELEADSIGVIYASASGYRADGLLRFLQRLDTDESGGPLREWTATHPPDGDRVEALTRQLQASGVDPAAGQELRERFLERTGRGDR